MTVKEEWKQKSTAEKVLWVAGFSCAFGVFVTAFLALFDIWPEADYLYMPLTALLMLIQAYENRKKSRLVMVVSLIAAATVALGFVCGLLA